MTPTFTSFDLFAVLTDLVLLELGQVLGVEGGQVEWPGRQRGRHGLLLLHHVWGLSWKNSKLRVIDPEAGSI